MVRWLWRETVRIITDTSADYLHILNLKWTWTELRLAISLLHVCLDRVVAEIEEKVDKLEMIYASISQINLFLKRLKIDL